jgi:ABC-type sulfate transport system permease component
MAQKVTSFSFAAFGQFLHECRNGRSLFVSLFIGVQTTIICLCSWLSRAYFLAEKKFNVNKVLGHSLHHADVDQLRHPHRRDPRPS